MQAQAPVRDAVEERGGARRWWLLTGALWLAHSAGLVLLADPPGAWFDGEPFLDQDWALHQLYLRSAEAFWRSGGRLWGYNPFFMAGYPANTIQDLSIKFYELAALLTPLASPLLAFKLWALALASAVPWACHAAFANFFDRRGTAAWGGCLAALLGTASWWNSLPREMLFFGMLGFPAACTLGLLALSWLWRIARSQARFGAVHAAWLASCAVLLPLHLQVSLVLALPGAVLLAATRSQRAALWALAGVALALAANAVWLEPLLSHRADARFGEAVDALPYFSSADPWTFVRDYATRASWWSFRSTAWEKPLRGALLLVGGAGATRLLRRQPEVGATLLAALVGLFALAYFGSLSDALRGWQCLRFKVALDAALALCAAYAAAARPDPPRRKRPAERLPALLLAAGLAAAAVNLALTETSLPLRMHARPRPPVPQLVEWLRQAAPTSGRLLFEESGDETGFFWDGSYLSALLPFWTGHQLIGGPANQVIDRHHVAEFHSGLLLGRPIEAWSDGELRRLLALYNVTAIVTFHPRSSARFAALGDPVERVRDFPAAAGAGRAVAWRVNRPASFFLAGAGRVRVGFDQIECSEVSGEEAILSFHWVEGLRSDPPVALEPHPVEFDPIPFVRIPDPPRHFTLSLAGRRERPQ